MKKRSPNIPKNPLPWAIDSALKVYEAEGMHSFPTDSLAQDLGYSSAKNGAAIRAIANLTAFSVIERQAKGTYRVNPELRDYKLVEQQSHKNELLREWLMAPKIYQELLSKYPPSKPLPSDNTLLYELVAQYGFTEASAKPALKAFKASVEFAVAQGAYHEEEENAEEMERSSPSQQELPRREAKIPQYQPPEPAQYSTENTLGATKYPIRLSGGRMAYIEVPDQFYEKDKLKLKAQLEIIGTVDEDSFEEEFWGNSEEI